MARAQDPHPAFKQYTVEDGLPSSKVYQVRQDSKGYMWFATDNGVSRFNGYEFEHFPVSTGLPDNTVFEIFEDKKGRIWFVTLTNKLFYYERDTMHLYKYNHLIDQIEGDHVKTSFCIADNGSVFLGLYLYGIIEITAQGKLKRHTFQTPLEPGVTVMEPVLGILVYADNYQGIYKGKIRFNTRFLKGIKENTLIVYSLHPSARFVRLKNKKILFSDGGDLYIIDECFNHRIEHFNERITWIYEDRDDDLWIGTYMGGVYHIENGDFEHKKNYLKELFITGVTQDDQGGFWFTTEGNSVYYTPSKEIQTYDQVSGLKDARVNCLVSDTEGIYLGLQRPMIHKITRSGTIRSYDFLVGNKAISSLYYDPEKAGLWFSGNSSSGFIKNNSNEISLTNNFAFVRLAKAQNSYWFINSDGLYKVGNERSPLQRIPKIKRINANLKKDEETLLLGAIDGLWEYNVVNGTYKHVHSNNSLLCNRILDMAYAKNGTLLLATKSVGLLILAKDGGVCQISHMNGLSSDNVRKVLIDGPVIWLATDKGLNKLVKNEKNTWQIKTYTTYDGLISNEIYDVHKFNDKIWLATDKGLSFFDPDMPVYKPVEMPLYIKQVMVNDSNKTIGEDYQLRYFENNIKISFIGLSYNNPGKQQYRYKMKGLNPQWSYTQEREIQYTTLPQGNYSFVVSVLHANGTWSGETCIKFTVTAPFWKTWWFVLLSVLAIVGALFFAISYWTSRKHEEKNKEEEINRVLLQLKLKALRAQMNPHFIFNVMNSIQHFVLYKNNEAAHRYLSKFSRLIRTILNNSDQNMVPLSEEVKALELYLDLEAMRFEKRFDYEIVIDANMDTDKVEIPSMLIQPYVENAVKHGILHSGSVGKIRIGIVKQDALLKCSIEDNGVGMEASLENKKSEYRSFGTSITKNRLSLINELYNNKLAENVINLYDGEGKPMGTRVEIFIPYTSRA